MADYNLQLQDNTRNPSGVDLTLVQRLRRWTNVKSTLVGIPALAAGWVFMAMEKGQSIRDCVPSAPQAEHEGQATHGLLN